MLKCYVCDSVDGYQPPYECRGKKIVCVVDETTKELFLGAYLGKSDPYHTLGSFRKIRKHVIARKIKQSAMQNPKLLWSE